MEFTKTFRDLPHLIRGLSQRGLHIGDEQQAIHFFKKVGYFRSGGYRYIFREMLPESEQHANSMTFRSDDYIEGAKLEDVRRFEEFDAKLREVFLKGVLDFEIRLRAALTHVLAVRDTYAHLDSVHLGDTCIEVTGDTSGTKFDAWERTCRAATRDSKEEDFVKHLLVKYGDPLPTWALVEILSFGSLPYLYELLKVEDQRLVAAEFGVKQPKQFGAWLRAAVDLRNYCAHGSRLFNRQLKRAIRINPAAINQDLLGHLAGDINVEDQRRFYPIAAILAYWLRSHPAPSNWHMTFKTQVRNLPVVHRQDGTHLVDTAENMGFPIMWESLPLWSK